MTELGETHRIGLMSNEVVDLLSRRTLLPNQKESWKMGTNSFVALKRKITDDLLYKILQKQGTTKKLLETNSISSEKLSRRNRER